MIMGGRVGDKSRRIDSILLLFSPTCIGCTHVPNKYTHACMRECARGVAQRVLPNASQGKTGVDGWGACKHAFVRAEVHACAVAREVTTLLQVRSSHPCIPQQVWRFSCLCLPCLACRLGVPASRPREVSNIPIASARGRAAALTACAAAGAGCSSACA